MGSPTKKTMTVRNRRDAKYRAKRNKEMRIANKKKLLAKTAK